VGLAGASRLRRRRAVRRPGPYLALGLANSTASRAPRPLAVRRQNSDKTRHRRHKVSVGAGRANAPTATGLGTTSSSGGISATEEKLETPIGEEEDSHLGDFIEDRSAVSPAENVINLNLKEQTDALLKTLTPREERVIKMRFGIGEAPSTPSRRWARASRSPASASVKSRPRRSASSATPAAPASSRPSWEGSRI